MYDQWSFSSWVSFSQAYTSTLIRLGTTLLFSCETQPLHFAPFNFPVFSPSNLLHPELVGPKHEERCDEGPKKSVLSDPSRVLLGTWIVVNDSWVVRTSNSHLLLRRSWPSIMVSFLSPWLLGYWRKETERVKHVLMQKWKKDGSELFSEIQIITFYNP